MWDKKTNSQLVKGLKWFLYCTPYVYGNIKIFQPFWLCRCFDVLFFIPLIIIPIWSCSSSCYFYARFVTFLAYLLQPWINASCFYTSSQFHLHFMKWIVIWLKPNMTQKVKYCFVVGVNFFIRLQFSDVKMLNTLHYKVIGCILHAESSLSIRGLVSMSCSPLHWFCKSYVPVGERTLNCLKHHYIFHSQYSNFLQMALYDV